MSIEMPGTTVRGRLLHMAEGILPKDAAISILASFLEAQNQFKDGTRDFCPEHDQHIHFFLAAVHISRCRTILEMHVPDQCEEFMEFLYNAAGFQPSVSVRGDGEADFRFCMDAYNLMVQLQDRKSQSFLERCFLAVRKRMDALIATGAFSQA